MRRLIVTVVVLLFSTAIVGLLTGGAYGDMVSSFTGDDTSTPEWVEYENDKVQNDGDANNDYNFGKSLKFDDGKAETALDDLFARMDGSDDGKADPVLGCAIALAMDQGHGTKFLDKWSGSLIGARANDAADYYVNDGGKGHKDEYLKMVESIKDEIKKGNISTEELNNYTSQMYQINGAYDNGKRPALTVKNTQNDGGTAIVIKWDDGSILKLRIQCGGQPVDVPDWNPPTKTTTPPPTTTAPPEETTPQTTTVTTLAPKDPSVAPVRPNDPDIGGKVDESKIHTDETPRETAPSSYVAPEPPTEAKKTETQTESVQTQAPPATEKVEFVTGAPYTVPFEEVAPATVPQAVATDKPHGELNDQQEKAADDKFG